MTIDWCDCEVCGLFERNNYDKCIDPKLERMKTKYRKNYPKLLTQNIGIVTGTYRPPYLS